MGFGMASIYATGLLWLEQYVTITSKIGATFTIASSLGPDVFPVILGQFIVATPMVLMYTTLALVSVCIALFFVAFLIGRSIKVGKTGEKNISNQDGETDQLEPLKIEE